MSPVRSPACGRQARSLIQLNGIYKYKMIIINLSRWLLFDRDPDITNPAGFDYGTCVE